MARCEGQVVEILFDADLWLSPADCAEPALEASHPIPGPLNISLPFARRCSTSSTISCASPIQLSPTLPPSATTHIEDAARNTSRHPTASFLPCSPSLHAASLFLSCVPGARKAVKQAQNSAIKQSKLRELKLVASLASKTNVQQLNKNTSKTEPRTQVGLFMGVMRRFR